MLRNPKKDKDYILLDEIRRLTRKTLDISLDRTGVYYYIKTHHFPLPYGLGAPRRWLRKEVMDWIETRSKA